MTRPDQSQTRPARRSFLRRLASDTRGNTLAIVGAALVPLTGMIGSGVDISRAYMAKTRLQAACDAATLAGRRVMSNDEVGTTVRAEAGRFFQFNFPSGVYGSDPITLATGTPPAEGGAENMFYVWRSDQGTVAGRAKTALPTGIMHLFGFETMDIQVDCEASQNFVNTDILLVLDTTASMLFNAAGGTTSVVADQRMTALRDAVMALYEELAPVQAQLEANNMRLRYGIVPYSSTVNVGALLRAENADFIADSWTYQSRIGIFSSQTEETFASQTNNQCEAREQVRTPATGYPAVEKEGRRPGNGQGPRDCIITTTTYTLGEGETFSGWLHEPVVHDTSLFKTGVSTPVPTRARGTTVDSTWRGCIEERDTDDGITDLSGYAIPEGAWDLNIDAIPSDEATRWRPHWPEVMYFRTGTAAQSFTGQSISNSDSLAINNLAANGFTACPSPARGLQAWTETDMQTYIDGLQAIGGTYHDIGMIWGARLISDAGVFADAPNTFNGMPVAKHLIFMTDGVLAPNSNSYSAYGVEYLDKRVVGSAGNNTQFARHERRFRMLCNSIKTLGTNRGGTGVSIWVVGFGTTVSPVLQECASNEQQVSTNANRAELIATFTEIGKNIGALRLTQ